MTRSKIPELIHLHLLPAFSFSQNSFTTHQGIPLTFVCKYGCEKVYQKILYRKSDQYKYNINFIHFIQYLKKPILIILTHILVLV